MHELFVQKRRPSAPHQKLSNLEHTQFVVLLVSHTVELSSSTWWPLLELEENNPVFEKKTGNMLTTLPYRRLLFISTANFVISIIIFKYFRYSCKRKQQPSGRGRKLVVTP